MTFLEHLDELRKRITHAVGALLVGFIIAFAFIDQVQAFIYQRLTADIPGGKLIFTEPGEGFFLWMKMAALTGVLISLPYVMWQVWLFIAPGLYSKEKKLAIPFVSHFLGPVHWRRRVLALFRFSGSVEILRGLFEFLHGVHASHRPGVRALREAVPWHGPGLPTPRLDVRAGTPRNRHRRVPAEELQVRRADHFRGRSRSSRPTAIRSRSCWWAAQWSCSTSSESGRLGFSGNPKIRIRLHNDPKVLALNPGHRLTSGVFRL